MALDLSAIDILLKEQSAIDTPATGTGGVQMDILPSQGQQQQLTEVVSELLDSTREVESSRQGSEFYNWQVDTEAAVGAHDVQIEAVQGGTWVPAATFDESTLTSCTITGSGVTLTFAAGNLLTTTPPLRRGMFCSLAGMSVAGNNSKPFPVLDISTNGRVLTIPSGYLADNATDSDFDLIIHRHVYVSDPYEDRLFTIEHYLRGIDRSLQLSNCRFNMFGIDVQPNKKTKLSFGAGGTTQVMLATGASPALTSATHVQAESLYLKDGGIYIGGTKRITLSGFNMRRESPVSGLPLIGTNFSPDAFLGRFQTKGQMTGTIADGADYDSFRAEDRVSIILHNKEQSTQNFIGFGIVNARFGGWNVPAGGEGPAIQTVPLFMGKDKRGAALGYAPATLIISTSAT